MSSGNNYALGDSASERVRLNDQAARLEKLSQRFLIDAGLQPGMRVLELGSGTGRLSKLIAERVGTEGQVIALERSPAMLGEARENLKAWQISNVDCQECDIEKVMPRLGETFDAVVGRLILTHMVDPLAVLRHAVEYVRPGGIVAFQEADSTLADHLLEQQRERLPLVWQVNRWIEMAEEGSSRHRYLGLELFTLFTQARLPTPRVEMHTDLQAGVSESRIASTVILLRNLLPKLVSREVSEKEIGLETLAERLRLELEESMAVQARTSIISAWAVKR